MSKLILLSTGAGAMWIYNNVSAETMQMVIGLGLAFIISLMLLVIYGLSNERAQLKQQLALTESLRLEAYRAVQFSEQRRRAMVKTRKPSMRRRGNL